MYEISLFWKHSSKDAMYNRRRNFLCKNCSVNELVHFCFEGDRFIKCYPAILAQGGHSLASFWFNPPTSSPNFGAGGSPLSLILVFEDPFALCGLEVSLHGSFCFTAWRGGVAWLDKPISFGFGPLCPTGVIGVSHPL